MKNFIGLYIAFGLMGGAILGSIVGFLIGIINNVKNIGLSILQCMGVSIPLGFAFAIFIYIFINHAGK